MLKKKRNSLIEKFKSQLKEYVGFGFISLYHIDKKAGTKTKIKDNKVILAKGKDDLIYSFSCNTDILGVGKTAKDSFKNLKYKINFHYEILIEENRFSEIFKDGYNYPEFIGIFEDLAEKYAIQKKRKDIFLNFMLQLSQQEGDIIEETKKRAFSLVTAKKSQTLARV